MAYGTPVLDNSENTANANWTLRRTSGSEWCSLTCTSTGWKLSMHDGWFTVVAETTGQGRPDSGAITALRSRLRDLGWNDVPQATLRAKPDRRRRPRD
jgi:hypothetical protein